jgi:hypothetical protein
VVVGQPTAVATRPAVTGSTAQPPTPAVVIGPTNYPPDVNPLTGLVMSDPSVLERRPLAIKVSNFPADPVRPQSGLGFADLVFEHYTEGGVTRLTAVFYGQSAQRVGSVRSGRLLDLEIAQMYDAIFVSSGFSGGVEERMREADWFERNFSSPFGYGAPYLNRIPEEGVASEHTLYADPNAIWARADEKGLNGRPDLEPGMTFHAVVPPGGSPATNVIVDYIGEDVRWEFDPVSGLYRRWSDGAPHLEELTNQQLAFANVIVVSANHVETDILEDTWAGGHWSLEIQTWGEGPVTIFRDGQRFEGRWHRADPAQMLTFTDLNGNVLALKPGPSFFQMVPLGFDRLIVEP